MKNNDEIITYSYDSLEHETPLSWLLIMDDKKVWLPKSICNIDEHDCLIDIPMWLAIEKELE